jgi:hypothetical protein
MSGTSFNCYFVEQLDFQQNPPFYSLKAANPEAAKWNPGLVEHVPYVVSGDFAGEWFSVPVVNAGESSIIGGSATVSRAFVWSKTSETFVREVTTITVDETVLPQLIEGQALPINMRISTSAAIDCSPQESLSLSLELTANFEASEPVTITRGFNITCRTFQSAVSGELAYTFTFLDVDGSVQYGAAIPPRLECGTGGCPILFSTHGATVDAASPSWTNTYRAQARAWSIFPTNRGAFGFDWQGAGRQNGLATLSEFTKHLPGVPNSEIAQYRADPQRVLFSGHSMGGHGCMIFSTHYADRAIASACLAGWIKLWQYSPTFIRQDTSFADSFLRGLLQASTTDYDTDSYLPNLVGVPFLARTGADDTAVNPWNLRRFARVLTQLSGVPSTPNVRMQEDQTEGQRGHWFNNITNDNLMQDFFTEHLYDSGGGSVLKPKPALPSTFEVFTLSLWSEGRGGIRILQQDTPRSAATVKVTLPTTGGEWTLATKNVKRFGLMTVPGLPIPTRTTLVIDGQTQAAAEMPLAHFCKQDGRWARCEGMGFMLSEKSNITVGPLRQVLQGPVCIIAGTTGSASTTLAIQAQGRRLANELFAQGHFGIPIHTDVQVLAEPSKFEKYNLVVIGSPTHNSIAKRLLPTVEEQQGGGDGFHTHCSAGKSLRYTEGAGDRSGFGIGPIEVSASVTDDTTGVGVMLFGACNSSAFLGTSTAAVTSTASIRLFALLAGTDMAGVELACDLFPTGSNMAVPDFIIAGQKAKWMGAGGYIATGFLGNDWTFRQQTSYPLSVSVGPAAPAVAPPAFSLNGAQTAGVVVSSIVGGAVAGAAFVGGGASNVAGLLQGRLMGTAGAASTTSTIAAAGPLDGAGGKSQGLLDVIFTGDGEEYQLASEPEPAASI